jgi:hypothetical protein
MNNSWFNQTLANTSTPLRALGDKEVNFCILEDQERGNTFIISEIKKLNLQKIIYFVFKLVGLE